MKNDSRSGVLVGGRNPDEIFEEGERKTKERENLERASGQTSTRNSSMEAGETDSPVPSTGKRHTPPVSPPLPQPSSSNGFDIHDLGDHFLIQGVPYTSGTPTIERQYTVELRKEILTPGTPKEQEFWAQYTKEKLTSLSSDPTIDFEWYAASAPFYMALIRWLRINQSTNPALVNEARLSVRRCLDHQVMTLTSITHANIFEHDYATHNSGTGTSIVNHAFRNGALEKRLTGPNGNLFSLGDEVGLSKVLLGFNAAVASDLFAWLICGGTSTTLTPYSFLQRQQRGPLLFFTRYPLMLHVEESSPRASPTATVYITCDKEDGVGNPIGVRIYDDKRRVVLP